LAFLIRFPFLALDIWWIGNCALWWILAYSSSDDTLWKNLLFPLCKHEHVLRFRGERCVASSAELYGFRNLYTHYFYEPVLFVLIHAALRDSGFLPKWVIQMIGLSCWNLQRPQPLPLKQSFSIKKTALWKHLCQSYLVPLYNDLNFTWPLR
jgi:hypothetical protein